MSQECATGCGRPTERYLCPACYHDLDTTLADLPDLLTDLITTHLTRRYRYTTPGPITTTTHDHPTPFDQRASNTLHNLDNALTHAVNTIHTTNQTPGPTCHHPCNHETCYLHRYHQPPPNTPRAKARWIRRRLDILANHPHAADIHNTLTRLAQYPNGQAWRTIDRPADKIFLGRCETTTEPDPTTDPGDGLARGAVGHYRCDSDLYAHPKAVTVGCPNCGTHHTVSDRREKLLTQLDDLLYTAAEIADLAIYLDEARRSREQTRKLINQWHRRGRIQRRQDNETGQPMFRFGDVKIELAKHDKQHERPAA